MRLVARVWRTFCISCRKQLSEGATKEEVLPAGEHHVRETGHEVVFEAFGDSDHTKEVKA